MNQTTVDLFNPKTIRSTMGSIYRVPFFVTKDLPGTISSLKEQQVNVYAAHLKGMLSYDEPDYKKKTAFLIEMRETDCRMRSQIWQILILRFQCRDRWSR